VAHTLGDDWTPSSGYAAGGKLAADQNVTAIFVANDQMALGVPFALERALGTVQAASRQDRAR
jgi:DNA-binding LacI/PurR family transcriptional regulator